MIPSTNEFFKASCRWHSEHRGIRYELSWHGLSDYSPQGTWCYYLFVTDEQFYADDWARLVLKKEDREFAGSWRRHWDYNSFPDLDAHGGWTFGELTTFLGRDGKEHQCVKVGCDYAHLWDREADLSDGYHSVEHDAKHSIDLLCEMFPKRRERCGYSGKFDDSSEFYTARNGRRVHKSCEEKLRADNWDGWWPVEAPAITKATGTTTR